MNNKKVRRLRKEFNTLNYKDTGNPIPSEFWRSFKRASRKGSLPFVYPNEKKPIESI